VSTAALLLLTALVLLLLVQAVHGCVAEIAAERERSRRRARVAEEFALAKARWDAGTRALEEALVPLQDQPAATGFGDSEIQAAVLRRALNAPDLVETEER
jgi:hypothetical protein